MDKNIISNSLEDNRFKSVSDFKWSVKCGAEIEFEYNEKIYAIFSELERTPNGPIQILFTQVYVDNQEATEAWFDNADELLEHIIDGNKLKDILTELIVWDRTI